MARRVLGVVLVLLVVGSGCIQGIGPLVGIEAEPPFGAITYEGRTELRLTQAGTLGRPEDPAARAWMQEMHRFAPADGTEDLLVVVRADLALPERSPRSLQTVQVDLRGPNEQHREATFEASGQRSWSFEGPAPGDWRVLVEGRGQGEVHVFAVVRTPHPPI